MKKSNILKAFFENPSSGGIVLLICAVFAVVMATVPSGAWFDDIWNKVVGINLGSFSLEMDLRTWVNDALMAVFFFTVGLEIKREVVSGQLCSVRRSVLPTFAALGGMLVPALIYSLQNFGTETASGWGIPMATDIAFAIGIISVLGSRVPSSLKIFLTALAIVDDLGAIVVLAVFYPAHALHLSYLLIVAGVMAVLVMLNKYGRNKLIYIVIGGVVMWYFTLLSGIHATIAGVLLATTVPISEDPHANSTNSMLHKLEQNLHPYVAFLIMPIFALSNAGVAFHIDAFQGGIPHVSIGIMAGLMLGKPLGIFIFSFLAIKGGFAAKPIGTNWFQIFAVSILGGIGFTMSIFISNLAFQDPAIIDMAKISILIASMGAAVIGLTCLAISCKK